MKRIIPIILVLGMLHAQTKAQRLIEKQFPLNDIEEVNIKFDFDDTIYIHSWDKDYMLVKIHVNINDNQNNDKFEFQHKTTGDLLSLDYEINNMKDIQRMQEKKRIDKDGNVYYIDGCSISMDIVSEIFIPKNKKLEIESISGDMLIDAFYSDLHAKSISGFVDLSLDENANANIHVKTITGTFYTNFEFGELSNKLKHQYVGTEFNGNLGSGNTRYELETISSNIYLRKN